MLQFNQESQVEKTAWIITVIENITQSEQRYEQWERGIVLGCGPLNRGAGKLALGKLNLGWRFGGKEYLLGALPLVNPASTAHTLSQKNSKKRGINSKMALTCKLLCIVFTLNYSFSLLKADVFFYEQELILHSRKDINNFYINLHAITSLTKKIEDSIAFFK